MKTLEETVQSDFPMLSDSDNSLIYFDNAATTLKPKSVIEAITRYYSTETATVHRGVYRLAEEATKKQHQVRESVRDFIGAKSSREILFTSGTTASLNLIAHSFGEAFIREGDEILISEIEHHSNIVPWQLLCQRKQATLKTIPVLENGQLDLKALQFLLSQKTKLVSFTHLSNALGVIQPVKEAVQIIRANSSAKIALDGAQSAAYLDIDVQALDVDFFAFSGHKLYGPTGIGVLYGKEELLEKMPPFFGGGDMIEEVTLEKTTYNELPYKFEAGTPHIAGVLGLGAAIEYLKKIGQESIQAHGEALRAYAEERLKEIPEVSLICPEAPKGPLLSFTVEGIHPLDLITLLNLKQVALRSGHLCAQPALARFKVSSLLRLSFAIYNTQEEVDRFILILKEVIYTLK